MCVSMWLLSVLWFRKSFSGHCSQRRNLSAWFSSVWLLRALRVANVSSQWRQGSLGTSPAWPAIWMIKACSRWKVVPHTSHYSRIRTIWIYRVEARGSQICYFVQPTFSNWVSGSTILAKPISLIVCVRKWTT